jgi:hypothetical protein
MGFSWWLTLAFIILKLTNFIDWSWWWVLSPVLITIAVLVVAQTLVEVIKKYLDK